MNQVALNNHHYLSVNINEYIYFTLTSKGLFIYQKYHIDMGQCAPTLLENENGLFKMQIWEFMGIFGNHLYNGSEPLFVGNNIYLDNELILRNDIF